MESYLEKRKSSVPEINLKKDLVALNDAKTNKSDTEILMKSIDVQQKQIPQFIVLFVEQLKTLIKSQKETKVSIQNKRMNILQSSVLVMNWIN